MSSRAQQLLRADMALTENGTPFAPYFRAANKRRGNSPTDISHLVFGPQPGKRHRLWITDRILEPQTVPHFMEFLMSGHLPGDRNTSLPLLTLDEVKRMTQPTTEWAPAPFNHQTRSTAEWIGIRIGSYEDSSRLWPIAKELHALKSRLWEGIPPLSERRWQELRLDDPQNFTAACRYFVAVIDVFAYLNNPRTKGALRQTFNLIWDHLHVFEQAVNAKRRADSEDGVFQEVSVTRLWYQYMRARYDSICESAHRWVIEHIDRIREPIIEQLGHHQPDEPNHISDKQWELTNKLHDLGENTSQADYMIFLPMDGYKGDSLPAKELDSLTAAHGGGFREEPIRFSANMMWRASDYSKRVRYLHRKGQYEQYEREEFRALSSDTPANDPATLIITIITQLDAQTMARQELRGLPQLPEVDHWIEYTRRQSNNRLGFVAYRLCHEYKPEKWDLFRTKFEADISDWGRNMADLAEMRQACKIHWIDGKDNDIADGDIEAAKKHFQTLSELPVHQRVFLAIDEATIKSYLEPTVNNQKSVLAVDARYDPNEETDDSESPGYQGTLRILGSLLWDELGALLVTQSALLVDLWPMVISDPENTYRGFKVTPVLKFPTYEETLRWEIASYLIPKAVAFEQAQGRR
ncbi:hypothetical protein FHETE_4219 [Fusarium heterosporum]|uniref:Uncharacterized protein n=1 Tax=Fusarium heterosporum TaxID=42747 RepID=A0A8H5TLG2_FUSHE|nr:hypothetical protein FHETE_4219 [Fusarium heterosporum]